MARSPQVTRKDDLSPEYHAIFDSIASSRGRLGGPFAVLMSSPEVEGRTAHLGAYIRYESTLSDADRELAIITTSREWDCSYEWSAHAPLALEAGVRQEAVDIVAHRGPTESLIDAEAAVVRYGRELLHPRRVSDATFKAAREVVISVADILPAPFAS
jgi:4-carboxymuconolactone decarboxylase